MTATAFVIIGHAGKVLSTHSTEKAAASLAERIGAKVETRTVSEGDRVAFTWQGWPKTGTVVEGKGSKVSVTFKLKAGNVTKSLSVEKLTFTR